MALREIDANIRPEDVNGRSPSSKDALLDIDLLQNALRENLKEIDERIKERTKRLSGDATFADDHTVDEAALLEEDKFWRHEIFTKTRSDMFIKYFAERVREKEKLLFYYAIL